VYDLLSREELSADQVAAAMGETVLSIRPRLSELAKKGLIEDSGRRAVNASGKRAIVWRRVGTAT
jgi:predicted ArsR family transcriptional regulator